MTDIEYGLLLPVVGLQALAWWLRTVRWRFLLSPFQPIPTTRLFSIVMTGAMINNLVPGRAGEFWRAHTVGRREGLSRATTFGTIVVERVIDGVVLVVLAAVMVLAIGPTPSLAILTASMLVVFGVALGGIASPGAIAPSWTQLHENSSGLGPEPIQRIGLRTSWSCLSRVCRACDRAESSGWWWQ